MERNSRSWKEIRSRWEYNSLASWNFLYHLNTVLMASIDRPAVFHLLIAFYIFRCLLNSTIWRHVRFFPSTAIFYSPSLLVSLWKRTFTKNPIFTLVQVTNPVFLKSNFRISTAGNSEWKRQNSAFLPQSNLLIQVSHRMRGQFLPSFAPPHAQCFR